MTGLANSTQSAWAVVVVVTGSLELDSVNASDVGLVGGGLVRATANVVKLNSLRLQNVVVSSTDRNYFHDIPNGLVWIAAHAGANSSSAAGLSNVNLSAIELGPATSVVAADGFHSVDVENVTATQVQSL